MEWGSGTSTQVGGNHTRESVQRSFPHTLFPVSMEVSSRDIQAETCSINKTLCWTRLISNRLRSGYCVKGSLVFDSDPARGCSFPFSLNESTGTLTKRRAVFLNLLTFLSCRIYLEKTRFPTSVHGDTDVFPFNYIGPLWYASWGCQGWTKVPVLSSLYVNMNMSFPCFHEKLALLAKQPS
jgi:hypothetical protein